MADLLTEAEIFKKIAWTGFWGERHAHKFTPSFGRVRPGHCHKTVSRMPACGNGKLMRTCSVAVLAEKAQLQSSGGNLNEKEHAPVGAGRRRSRIRPACAGGFCRRYEKRHHVQGRHVERLDVKESNGQGQN